MEGDISIYLSKPFYFDSNPSIQCVKKNIITTDDIEYSCYVISKTKNFLSIILRYMHSPSGNTVISVKEILDESE